MAGIVEAPPAHSWAVQQYDRLAHLVMGGGLWRRYSWAILTILVVSAGLASSRLDVDLANISLAYLLAVFFTASVAGLGPGILASLLSFLLYNLLFVHPLYVLTVANPQDLLRLIAFLVAALLASTLAALALERAQLLRQIAAQQAVVSSERFKSTLLASVSHDLRTPLVTITGVATALRDGGISWQSAARAEMIDTLVGEAQRLNRLVGNLLEMTRVESGALEATRAWEEVGDITGGVLARLRAQINGRPVRVAMSPDLPLVWVNAALLDQVLTNLIENALKYSPPATPLSLSASVHADELWLTVADAGPGIPPEALPRVFDKFFRVAAPGVTAQGMGLGLAIARGIVEAHGGRIWAENRPDGGAAFTLTLPLHPRGAAPPQPFEPE